MFAFLNGVLRAKYDGIALIECSGIGYEVVVTNSAYCNLPEIDENVKVYTYLHLREDEIMIFGFESMEEKNLFLRLISVSGVGSKTAIQILSGIKQSDLVNAIVGNNVQLIANIKGIGKKTAERIILELKDKLNPYDYVLPLFDKRDESDPTAINDAVMVLTSLGISKQQATMLARKVAESTDNAEQIVAKALKNM